MKPTAQRLKSLAVTPELVHSARDIVSIYDRIDWEQLHKADCDTVHLNFQSAEATEEASHMMLEMAAGEPALRNTLISKIRTAIGAQATQGGSRDKGEKDSVRRLSLIKTLLADLVAEQNSRRFADLCKQAWLFKCRRPVITPRKSAAGVVSPPIPMGRTDKIPGWLGLTGDQWIGVPARLAFAESLVDLCRRIAEINTGETTLRFEPGEELSLRLHHCFWAKCKPRSYRVPIDDFSHPLCHQLQASVDVFLPKVRAMVSACIEQGMPPEIATAEKTQRVPATTTPQAGVAEQNQAGRKLVQIHIGSTGGVQIVREGVKKLVSQALLRDALRAIAALTESGSTKLHVNNQNFVELTHRSKKNVSKKMYAMKVELDDIGIGMDDSVGQGESHFSGFKVVFDESPDGRRMNSQDLVALLAESKSKNRHSPEKKG